MHWRRYEWKRKWKRISMEKNKEMHDPNKRDKTRKRWKTKKKKKKRWMDSLFNGISTCRLFNAKAILLEEQQWYYLTHSWEDKGVHTFPKGIGPKGNVIARLEYELAYYESAVHRFNHYTTRTPREDQQWYYLTHSWEDKGVHTFPKGIGSKVNVIGRLEYELAYYESAVHRFNHYTTRTPREDQ